METVSRVEAKQRSKVVRPCFLTMFFILNAAKPQQPEWLKKTLCQKFMLLSYTALFEASFIKCCLIKITTFCVNCLALIYKILA